jgi:serpin B
MRRHVFLGLALAIVFGDTTANRAAAGTASPTADQWKALLDGNCSFAVDSYRQLRSSEGNLFFSPYSISTALALAYGGARGETEKQMAKVLHFSLDQSSLHAAFGALQNQLNRTQKMSGLKLLVANSLWPQQGYRFRDAYLSLARERYGVSMTPVDYEHATEAARKQVNLWVEQKTEQKIKDLIQPGALDVLTRLVLINAIYFKGAWEHEFDPEQTKDSSFFVTPEKSVTASMMTQTTWAGYAESESLQVLSMPYVNSISSMLVLLPRAKGGLQQLEDNLSADNLKRWRERMPSRRVEIFLPKFKITRRFLLNSMLQNMGMADAFRFRVADFSGMADTRELFISAVIHKAFADVTEKGTEAAAATAVMVAAGWAASLEPPKPPVVFRADHPFLFLIQDNRTGTILFLGRLTDPTRGGQ